MTHEDTQRIMESTFGNLVFFCRDAHVDERQIRQYQLGQILEEHAFTDVSYKLAGLAQNCRYLIASSNWKDLSGINPAIDTGHALLSSGSLFKVLSVQQSGGKAQILLLHIPTEGLEYFSTSESDFEKSITEKGAEIFKENLTKEPLPELQTSEWLERTSYPVGFDEEGKICLVHG